MQTQTLAMDWIFQPAKWQPLRWVAEWLREQSARQRERRQAPRRRVANLAANYLDGTGAARHVVRDVSTSGAFIFADFKWPPGTIVRMTLQLEGHPFPAATLVRTKAVRCAPAGLGVQFLPVKKAERRSLANSLKSIPKSRPFTVGLYPEEGLGEISALEAVRQEAVLTNADEATRQNVLDEPPQELYGVQPHFALLVAAGIVLPAEHDMLAIKRRESVIADGHTMRVAAEIP